MHCYYIKQIILDDDLYKNFKIIDLFTKNDC